MQSLSELPPGYLTELTKLDQLLRMYQVARKSGTFHLVVQRTKEAIERALGSLRRYTMFSEVERDVVAKVNKVLLEAKPSGNIKPKSANDPEQSNKASHSNPQHKSEPSLNKIPSSESEKSQNFKKQQKTANNPLLQTTNEVHKEKQSQPSLNSSFKASLLKKPETKSVFSVTQNKVQKKEIQPQRQEKVEKVEPKGRSEEAEQKFLGQKVEQKQISIVNSQQVPKGIVSIAELVTPDLKEHTQSANLISISNSQPKEAQVENSSSQKCSSNSEKFAESISTIKKIPVEQSESFYILNSSEGSEPKVEISSTSKKEDDEESVFSERCSEESSGVDVTDLIAKFCSSYRSNLNFCLLFNNELFEEMDEHLNGQFYLFGVNRPENKHFKELYACTLMKFLTAELTRSESQFEHERKEFTDKIRVPLGLIFKGEGPSAITPEHIKFLLTVQSPFPVILVIKDDSCSEGFICTFSESLVDQIRMTPRKDLAQCAEELKKNMEVLPYNEKHFPADKNKVMTKLLYREIPKLTEQAPNAITISGNECIKEEKNCFTYKLHAKYMTQMKNNELFIYYVNDNVVSLRRLFQQKELEAFRKLALEHENKAPMILGFTATKDAQPVKREFFEILLETRGKRDAFFFLNLVSLTAKKTIVGLLKAGVTLETVKSSQEIQFKDFQKDTLLTQCVHVISKVNIKDFQSEKELVTIASK